MTDGEPDTMNWALVGVQGDNLIIMGDVHTPFTRERALALAAWLVTLAELDSVDDDHNEFNAYLRAVEAT